VPKRPNHPPPDLERRNGKGCLLAQAVQVLARANAIRELQFDLAKPANRHEAESPLIEQQGTLLVF